MEKTNVAKATNAEPDKAKNNLGRLKQKNSFFKICAHEVAHEMESPFIIIPFRLKAQELPFFETCLKFDIPGSVPLQSCNKRSQLITWFSIFRKI